MRDSTATQSMSDLLASYKPTAQALASEDKAKHERAYYVELTRKALGTNLKGKPYTFGQVNGLTRKWSTQKLRERYYYCQKADIFGKVWFGMRKQDKQNGA